MHGLKVAATVLAFLAGNAAAGITEPVTVKGNAFFVGDKRFYVRGLDYQPGGSSELTDPLATDSCLRDIPYFQQLGINTIRVYTIDNSKNHDKCMNALSDAGIYLILDVNTPKFSIKREYPKESYNSIYIQHVFATVDVFGKYTNTLGFFAANEVVDSPTTTGAATYVKAIIRDMKAYIKKHQKRHIPVGYSAADVTSNRMQIAQYLNCGDEELRSEFHGVNDYSWCGESTMEISGWGDKVKNYTDYSIPVFLSEYGCNTVPERPFNEVEALYSDKMTHVFSGGLVYEYSMEPNKYGIVQIDTLDAKDVKTLPDFDNLKAAFKKTPIPDDDGGYKENGQPSKCPPRTNSWEALDDIPPMPDNASKYLELGAGKPRGTNGPSNQYIPSKEQAPTDTGVAGPAPTDSGEDNVSSTKTRASGSPFVTATSSVFVGGEATNTQTSGSASPSQTSSSGADAAAPRAGLGKMFVAAVVVMTSFLAGMMM
ncbi:hypothetical protein L211DRAFT_808082 [Terfezia boudieri ATCC MYA-4762]|uniref:1,3-beta-glucanosyltransferase n=1 Tax=Terfezia boudieri ATCC MYA-4762 TaxID=1051890 RepID=A0A3N4LRH4_9PEZI|nr:hypothetical protein L211DRAFT_808082 [Terfezia boudieri ATCC MYA-4762]